MDYEALKASIREDEGFRSSAYTDSRGFWTIGYGRLIDKRLGGGITRAEAEFLLNNDLQACLSDLEERFHPWFSVLSDARQRALVELRFQLGMTKFLGFQKMIRAFENAHYKEAASELLDSHLAQECPERTQRLAALIRAG